MDRRGMRRDSVLMPVIFAFALIAAVKTAPLPPLVVEDLLAHDRMAVQALMRHDIEFLSKHIADDAIYTGLGKKLTKRMYLASVMEQPVVTAPVKTRYSNVSTRVKDGVVELTA